MNLPTFGDEFHQSEIQQRITRIFIEGAKKNPCNPRHRARRVKSIAKNRKISHPYPEPTFPKIRATPYP
jgi:hypothetical protein